MRSWVEKSKNIWYYKRYMKKLAVLFMLLVLSACATTPKKPASVSLKSLCEANSYDCEAADGDRHQQIEDEYYLEGDPD